MTTTSIYPITSSANADSLGLIWNAGPSGPDAAHLYQYLADHSDLTFIFANNISDSASFPSELWLTWGTPSLPALSQIRQVQFVLRGGARTNRPDGGALFNNVVVLDPGRGQDANNIGWLAPANSLATLAAPVDNGWVLLLSPQGDFWTVDDFARLQVVVRAIAMGPQSGAATDQLDLSEVRFDITVNEAPTVALAAFTNPVVATSRPTLQWVYADPENDTEERFEYRVYAQPGGGWAGFDPDTTTEIPTLAEVLFTTVTSYRVPSVITNGTYRVYARAADTGSQGRFGPWGHTDLVLNVPAPTVPTLTVFDDPAHCRVEATVGVASTAQPFGVTLERQNSDGSWSTVYECDSVPTTGVAGAWQAALYDRTAPRGASLNYRARSWFGDHDLQSAPSTVRSTRLDADGKTWLICSFPHDGTLDLACIQAGGITGDVEIEPEDMFEFGPEGRPDGVAVHGTIHSPRSATDVAFILDGDAQLAAWRKIRAQKVPVLMKTLHGDAPLMQRWITFGTPAKRTALGCSGPRNLQNYRMEVPWFTTSQPPG